MPRKNIPFIFLFLIAVSLSLAAAGCGQRAAQPAAPGKPYQTIKVGAIFDVTGTGSTLGVPAEQSARMVVEKINAEGGINGIPLEVVFLNNESVEDRSVLAFNRLVGEDKVLAVAGASQSGTTLAMVPAATEAEVPLVSAAAAVSIVEPQPDRRWIFKVAPNDSHVISRTLQHMLDNGIKRIAWLSVNNAFGHSGKKQLELLAPQMGIEVVQTETFEAQDADMRVQLTRINAARPDAVFVWGLPPAASIITRNFRELGLKMPLYHSHGVGSRRFLDLAEGTADGVMFAIGPLIVAEQIADAHLQKPVLLEYIRLFEGKHGPRSTFGAHGYDAMMLIVRALKNTTLTGDVTKDRALLRDEIEKIQDYVGIGGIFSFSPTDHVGLNAEDLVMVRVENNEWKLIAE
ncbi:MAG: ABC transporter substrate-binding protein [Firmicutes bacterium]|nr:ABC transporter substrate-binding protein [Bacillota bacterium]